MSKNETAADLRDTLRDKASDVRETTADAFATAREKVGTALDTAREGVSHAYESVSDTASTVGHDLLDAAKSNPLLALAGGLAAGAIAGLLIPRSEREIQAFSGVGRRLNAAARDAGQTAKAAGMEKLDELGLSQDRAGDTISKLFADVAKAATHAGGAALGAVGKSGRA